MGNSRISLINVIPDRMVSFETPEAFNDTRDRKSVV